MEKLGTGREREREGTKKENDRKEGKWGIGNNKAGRKEGREEEKRMIKIGNGETWRKRRED